MPRSNWCDPATFVGGWWIMKIRRSVMFRMVALSALYFAAIGTFFLAYAFVPA
jgi:hypothetical protein